MISLRLAGLLLFALTLSCTLPHTKVPVSAGTVTLQLAPPSRTVGVEWSSVVKTYAVTLTKVADGSVVAGATAEGETSLTLTGISVGLWNIVVDGKDTGGAVVARATLSNQSLPSSNPIAVTVKPLTGTGGFSFQLRFLQPAEVADQITAVHGQLYTLGGMPFGAGFPFATEDFVFEDPYQAVIFARSGIDAGAYRLSISLQRGGQPARYLSEAINIAGGVTADRWIAPDGTVRASRDLTLADFTSTNTALGDLELLTEGLAFAADGSAFVFDDATTTYNLKAASTGTFQTLTFTPSVAMDGQTIEYSGDGGSTWTKLLTATSGTANLTAGSTTLLLRVTATDGIHTAIYTVNVLKAVLASSVTISVAYGGPTLASNEAKPIDVTFGNSPTDTSVTFSSSDPTVATVSWDNDTDRYWIFGNKVGSTTITAQQGGVISNALAIEVYPGLAELQSRVRGVWVKDVKAPSDAVAVAGNATARYVLTQSGSILRFQSGVWQPFATAPSSYEYLALGPDGTLYAGEPSSNTVYRLDGIWEPLPGTLTGLTGLAVDREGQVFVADSGQLKVRSQGLWTSLGSLPVGFQSLGGGDGITSLDSTLTTAGTLWSWDAARWVVHSTVPLGTVATTWAQGQKTLRKY